MIVPMKRLTLVGLKSDEDATLAALQAISAVEILPPRDFELETELIDKQVTKSAALEKLIASIPENEEILRLHEETARRFDDAVRVLTPYTKKPSLLAPLPEITKEELLSEESLKKAASICAEIERTTSRIAENKSRIAAILTQQKQLSPWQGLDIDVEQLHSQRKTDMTVGFVPNSAYTELVANASDLPYTVRKISSDTQSVAALIVFIRDDSQEVKRELAAIGFTEYSFQSGITGKISGYIEGLHAEVSRLRSDSDKQYDKLEKELSQHKFLLQVASDATRAIAERERAKTDILVSKSTYLVEGWVRSDETAVLEAALDSITGAYFLQYDDPAEGEMPPSVVKNSKFITPFETVTNMYSRPDPINGIDATPFMAPFYMLFFGMMLSDSGYGLVLFLGGLLYNKLKKPRPGMAGLVSVISWCGLATVICGFLFGTCFGMSWNSIFFGTTEGPFPLIFDPMKESMTMLLVTFGMGIIHMLYGVCIRIYMCIKKGDTASAIFDNLSWIFIIVGIVGYAIVPNFKQPFIVLAAVGVLLLLLFAGRANKGIKRITGGLGALYNITGYLSDTVSYARIFALGLATGAMGEVFNMLGSMVAGSGGGFVMQAARIIAAALVLLVLHLFSLFLNTLGSFAHTARLQYVEFFGKFYETGGSEFKPLGYHTGYVNIKK